MADSQLIESLRQTRDGYDAERTWHRFLLNAYSGGGGFRGRVEPEDQGFWGSGAAVYSAAAMGFEADAVADTYLDRFPREDTPKFKSRVELAHYKNYVAPLTDIKLAYLLGKDPGRELGPKLMEWRQNVDGAGTPWSKVYPSIVRRVANLGWTPVLVDLPRAAPGMTRAQALEAGVTPRMIPLFPGNLLDFRLDDYGGFVWAKIRTTHIRQDNWRDKPKHVERYALWARDTYEIFEIWEDGSTQRVESVDEGPHPFKRVPLTICKHGEAADGIKGIPMHGQVAIENKALFNRESELDDHIRSQVFAILQVPTDDPENMGTLILGTDNAVAVKPDSRQGFEYIAPPASVAETLETRIENTIREMYRMARYEYTRPTAAATSAESHAFEFQQTSKAIGDFSESLGSWEDEINVLVATIEGEKPAKATVPAKNFDIENLLRDIEEIGGALGLDLGPAANAEIRKRAVDRVLPDLDDKIREAIRDEIDERSKEMAAMGAMGAEMLASLSTSGKADSDDDDPEDDPTT